MKINNFYLVGFLSLILIILNGCAPETNAKTDNSSVPVLAQSSGSKPEKKVTKMSTPTPDSTIATTHLMGKFNPIKDEDFVEIDIKYADRPGQYLHKETYAAFIKMFEAAQKDGIKLTIRSATRNFAAQKNIWEGKWNGKRLLEGNEDASKLYPNPVKRALKILEYSSMPGTSRHHWGTDIDINAFVNSYFEKGKGLKEYEWLVKHGKDFGFCQPYTPKGDKRPDGYNEEKWHWSYLPLAKRLSDQYQIRLTDQDISGFDGAETAPEIGIVKKYVLGINHQCL